MGAVFSQYIDDLEQDCSNSIANPLEVLQSCTKPSKYVYQNQLWVDKIHTNLSKYIFSKILLLFSINIFKTDVFMVSHFFLKTYKLMAVKLIYNCCTNFITSYLDVSWEVRWMIVSFLISISPQFHNFCCPGISLSDVISYNQISPDHILFHLVSDSSQSSSCLTHCSLVAP